MGNPDYSMKKTVKILSNVKDTYETTKLGYDSFRSSKEKLKMIPKQYRSAAEYEEKTGTCIWKTILFCVVMIAITIGICVLL